MEHITVKLNLSEKQLKQLSKGIVQSIRNEQIGHGVNVKMSRNNAKKALNGLRNNKGFRLKLEEHEIHGSGLGFKKFGKQAKSALKDTYNDVKKAVVPIIRERANQVLDGRRLLNPEMDAALKNMGIKKMIYDAGSAIKPSVSARINGEGILGKRFDKMLSRKGIKKEVYKIGSAFKPLVHQAINAAGTLGQAYGIPTAPMSAFAHQYVDHPEDTQRAVRAIVGNGINKPKLLIRSNSSNIIDSENANFYPCPMPTFKQRQHGGSFKI